MKTYVRISNFWKSQDGATAIEYGLIALAIFGKVRMARPPSSMASLPR